MISFTNLNSIPIMHMLYKKIKQTYMNPVKYDMHTGVLGSRYLDHVTWTLIELSSSLLVIDLQTQKVEN